MLQPEAMSVVLVMPMYFITSGKIWDLNQLKMDSAERYDNNTPTPCLRYSSLVALDDCSRRVRLARFCLLINSLNNSNMWSLNTFPFWCAPYIAFSEAAMNALATITSLALVNVVPLLDFSREAGAVVQSAVGRVAALSGILEEFMGFGRWAVVLTGGARPTWYVLILFDPTSNWGWFDLRSNHIKFYHVSGQCDTIGGRFKSW